VSTGLVDARRLLVLAAAGALALPSAAVAQGGLRLGDAVSAALAGNPGIRIARLDMEGARADVLRARGAFDTRLSTRTTNEQRATSSLDETGAVGPEALSSRTSSFSANLSRELPGGMVLQPALSVTRVDDPRAMPLPYAQAGASLAIVAPLGPNRGGGLTRSAVREAELGRDATAQQIRQTAATSVRDVVGAYWEYRAAYRRAEVLASAEARAGRLLDETRTLVAAEERPAADLIQLQANLASKRIQRLNAEQQLEAVRHRLGLLMGLDAGAASRLAPPADSFPPPVPFRAGAAAERLVETAAARRGELAASVLRADAARLRHSAARAGARPTVDLTVELGYSGLTTSPGLGGTLSPLYSNVPGLNLSLQLSYQAALTNSAARGNTVRAAAAVSQQRLALEGLRQQVASGVLLAAGVLERSLTLLAHAEEAVRLFGRAVENEKAKHALGTATLIDVILAEDSRTSALLGEVDAKLGHANALSRLRWETGTLLEGEGAELRFIPDAATTPPAAQDQP
jgi:outer membrane protein TolC